MTSSTYPKSRLAAVLVILYEQDGLIRVLLTTRSKELRTHAGQTALPGGKRDDSDVDAIANAVCCSMICVTLTDPHPSSEKAMKRSLYPLIVNSYPFSEIWTHLFLSTNCLSPQSSRS